MVCRDAVPTRRGAHAPTHKLLRRRPLPPRVIRAEAQLVLSADGAVKRDAPLGVADAGQHLRARRVNHADRDGRVREAGVAEGLKIGVLVRRDEQRLPGHLLDKAPLAALLHGEKERARRRREREQKGKHSRRAKRR